MNSSLLGKQSNDSFGGEKRRRVGYGSDASYELDNSIQAGVKTTSFFEPDIDDRIYNDDEESVESGSSSSDEQLKVTTLASRKATATFFQTVQNLGKGYLGSGILGLPYAFLQGGVLSTIIALLMIGVISTHAMYLLVEVKHRLVKTNPNVVTFSDIARAVFGSTGGWIVDLFLVFTQFGFCCAYVVFVAQNTAAFFEDVDWRLITLAWFPVFLALSYIKTLKNVAWITTFGNIAVLLSIVIILTASGIQISRNQSSDDHSHDYEQRTYSGIEWFFVPQSFAVMVGTSIYAYEGIGTVVPCETSMKNPEKFSKVLFLVMGVSVLNYIIFGFIPYLAFGSSTSDLITENLAAFANGSDVWKGFSTFTSVLLIAAIAATYPLQLFPVTDICEEWIFKYGKVPKRYKSASQYAFRTGAVLLSIGVAIAIPNFGLLMGFIGSIGSSALQFIFPIAFILQLDYFSMSIRRRALYIFYLCFGGVAGALGFLQTLQELITGDD